MRYFAFLLAGWLVVMIPVTTIGSPPVVSIGFATDGPHELFDWVIQIFQTEISALFEGEYDVRFPADAVAHGDWTEEGARAALGQLLNDPDVDLVLTMGPMQSYLACMRTEFPKPTVAPFVFDAELEHLPKKDGGSGIANLNYLSVPYSLKRDFESFRDIVPFTNLTVLYHTSLNPALADEIKRQGMEMGITTDIVLVGQSVDEALGGISEDAEAVYIGSMMELSSADYVRLIDGLSDMGLPTFSVMGWLDVERGAMAGTAPQDIAIRRARRTALNIHKILLGQDAKTLPVTYSEKHELAVNYATARKVGVDLTWSVLTEAKILNQEREEVVREWTLESVMQEAVDVNLDILTQHMNAEAGRQTVKEAWSNLLPQIEVGATGVMIDDDRAAASYGQVAERTYSGYASMRQLLFSEGAWANVSIQKYLQEGREYALRQIELDIALEAAVAYLNVLRAKTLEQIQRENLKVTRSNLDLAQVREVVGVAGPAEVYRWEAEMAQRRMDAISANSQRNLAEIQLNRVLQRPSEEAFGTVEEDLSSPEFLIAQVSMIKMMDGPHNFRLLREFFSEEGLRNSPELAQLDAAIASQKRAYQSASRAHYTPTLGIQADVENVFAEEGEGSDVGPSIADDVNWSVGANISLQIFQGGGKFARQQEAKAKLRELQIQRQSTADKIEQQIRSAMHTAGASLASIELSVAAAEAAKKSLEVVTDAYANGTVSTIELLDAQNAALVTEQAAANAMYTFLIDYMYVQRAWGQFHILMDEEERMEFLQRFDGFVAEATK